MQYLNKVKGRASGSASKSPDHLTIKEPDLSQNSADAPAICDLQQKLREQSELLTRTQQALQAEISARKQAEEALSRAHYALYSQVRQQHEQRKNLAARLRQLSLQVIKAQEEERKRVSRELHDDAGQALTILKVSLELIHTRLLESQVDPPICKRLSEAIGLCESTMAHIRMLAHGLRPAALDDLGLNMTLDGFCQDFTERTQISIVYEGVETPPLEDAAEICLYRCLQEGLTNVAKHACATQVLVRLNYDESHVRLLIEDNGRGTEKSSQEPKKGIGLLGLHERLASLGGQLEIVSYPGKGTCLSVKVSRREAGFTGDNAQE